MSRGLRRTSLLVSVVAAVVVSPTAASARPPGAPVAHTFTAPWSVSRDYSHCEWPDATVVCSASSAGDARTGEMTVAAELRPAGSVSSARSRAVAEHGVMSTLRLKSPVSGLRLTFTIRVASAETVADATPVLPASWSRVFVRANALHSDCAACAVLVSQQIASSQPEDLLPRTVADQTYTLVVEMRNPAGGDLPPGTLRVRPLLYSDVESFADRTMTAPASGRAAGTATSVKVEQLPVPPA